MGTEPISFKKPVYCHHFRLDQVPEATQIRNELIELALLSADWDKRNGRPKSKSASHGLKKFVFNILSESQSLKDLLATCPSHEKLLSVEKVRIASLKDLALPPKINALGRPTDRVPSDAMIFVGQSVRSQIVDPPF